MRKLGFNAFWWEDLHGDESVRNCAAALRDIGYDYVEYKLDSFDSSKGPLTEFPRAARLTREEGLEVSNFVVLRSLSDPNTRNASVADIKACLNGCAAAGVNVLNIVTGDVGTCESKDWWRPSAVECGKGWESFTRSLEEVVSEAERCGVCLAVEPIVGTLVHDCYTLEKMLRLVDSPYLGVTLDPSHLLLYRNDIPWAVRQLGDKIKHVHVKDAVGRPGVFGLDFLFPLLGEGAIDWGRFFSALDDVGYEGVLSAEFESFKYMYEVLGGDPVAAATQTMASLRKLTSLP